MELIGTLEGKEYPIQIRQLDERRYSVTVEDRTYEVDTMEFSAGLFSILHGDRSYEVRLNGDAKAGQLEANFYQHSFEIDIADPMKKLLEESLGGGAKGEVTVAAPMPGQVQRVLVQEGDEVEADQGVVVLIAMKMENELTSPKKGVVKKVLINEGDNVEGSAPLIVVA